MRNWILAVAAVGVLGGATLVGVGMTRDDAPGALPLAGVFKDASPTPAASPTPTGPSPEELRKIERAKQVKALDAALKKYAKTVPEFSVAVLDRRTGRSEERRVGKGGRSRGSPSHLKKNRMTII